MVPRKGPGRRCVRRLRHWARGHRGTRRGVACPCRAADMSASMPITTGEDGGMMDTAGADDVPQWRPKRYRSDLRRRRGHPEHRRAGARPVNRGRRTVAAAGATATGCVTSRQAAPRPHREAGVPTGGCRRHALPGGAQRRHPRAVVVVCRRVLARRGLLVRARQSPSIPGCASST